MSKVMKKNLLLLFNCVNYIELKHTIRIMKITTVLTLIAIFQLSATSLHSQNAKVSINRNNLPLKEFINEIERQTDYLFMYSEKEIDLQEQVQVNAKNKPVSKVLEEVFGNSEIAYNFNEGYISLRTKGASVQQKQKKITGVVSDNLGPVAGANIMIKGSTIGTVTDMDGRFTLEVPEQATLVISYIGFLPQEIQVGNKSEFAISLKEDTKLLDEVVVIGYGTTSAKIMVSAVTSVKGEKLQELPFNSVATTLQGRASGVIIQEHGSEPGAKPKVSIRGGGDPVYVIDGVISRDGWEFQTLNPDDIESISVLKDAASLAVYGSRAADGIIMVKTKEGRKGKTAITYSFNAQFSQPTFYPDKVDGYTFAVEQNNAGISDGFGPYSRYSEEVLETIKNQTNPYVYANTDWRDLVFNDFAPEYKHSLSMSGNAKDINYYLSLGALDQGSLYSTPDALSYKRYNVRSNINTTFDKIGLKVALNVNAAMEKRHAPSVGANGVHYNSLEPVTPAFNQDGTYTSLSHHPLAEMDERSGYNKEDGLFVNTQFIADWVLPWIQGLSLGTMLHYRLNSSHVKKFVARAPQYNTDGSEFIVSKPHLKEEAYFGEVYNLELNASYQKTFFEKHNIDAKAVFTVTENTGSDFWASRRDYLSSKVDQLFAGPSVGMQNSGKSEEGGRMGVVGRLKYDYDNRYYIEGSFRYDGSDNFAPGYRWGFFPSVAAAWDITEEPFFKALNLSNVNLLKIRASYGKTGTETDVERFGYLSTYSLKEDVICIGGKSLFGFSEGALVAPELLTWYTRNSLNYGLDYAFLNNRIKGNIDYFYYVTEGGLMSPKDRYTTPLGKDLPQIKSDSKHRREGFEFNAKWSDNVEDFTYEIGTNMTYYNNLWVKKADEKITDLKNPWKRVTHQTDHYKDLIYMANGLYHTPEQILNSARRLQSSETKLGDISYQDINGDGKIDSEDQIRYGMPTEPHFTYGVDFLLGYKGFTLSGLFYGTGKRNIIINNGYRMGEARVLFDKVQLDYWREDNQDASFPRTSLTSNVNGGNNQEKSTFWVKNASYLRLKNLTLGYDFKYSVLKNVPWISTCKINLTGTNLFTISGINDFQDPETEVDYAYYPFQRVYSLGVLIGF